MGRHVISVTVTGNAADFDRAVRRTQKAVAGLGDSLTQLGKQSELTRRLKANAREIGRFGVAVKKSYGNVEGLGKQLDRLRSRETIRIKSIVRLEELNDRMRKFGLIAGLATTAMAGWQLAVGAAAAAGTALAGVLAGAGGVGLIAGFGLLWAKTEEGTAAFQKLGAYIKKDLLTQTLKPFYREFAKIPEQLTDAYKGVRPVLADMGDALADITRQVADLLPTLAASFARLGKAIADAGAAGWSAELVRGVATLGDGLTRFFKAFADGGDPLILRRVFESLADGIGRLGEVLADVTAEDFNETWDRVGRILGAAWDAIKRVTGAIARLDDAMMRLTGNRAGIEALVAPLLTMWLTSKLLVPVIGGLSKVWQKLNIKAVTSAIATKLALGKTTKASKKATDQFDKLGAAVSKDIGKGFLGRLATAAMQLWQWVSKVAGVLLRFAKVTPVAAAVSAAIMGIVGAVKDFGDESTFLGGLWADTIKPAIQGVKDAWAEVKAAWDEAFTEIKSAWDELVAALEESGALPVIKKVASALGKLIKVVAGLAILGQLWALLKGVTAILKLAAGAIKLFAKWIKFVIGVIKQFVAAGQPVRDAIQQWWDALGGGAGIIEAVGQWFTNLAATIDGAVSGVVAFIDGAWATISGTISGAMGNIVGAVTGGFSSALSAAMGVASQFVSVGVSMVQGVISGIGSMIGSLVSQAVAMAKSAFNAAKNALGINSPAKVMIPLGEAIPEGVAVGVRKNTKTAVKSIQKMSADLVKAAGGKKAKKKTKEALATFRESLKEYKQALKEAVEAWKDWRAEVGKPVYKKGSLQALTYALDQAKQAYSDAAAAAQELREEIAGPSAFQQRWDQLRDTISGLKDDIAGLKDRLADMQAPAVIDQLAAAWESAAAALDDARGALRSWFDELRTSPEEALRDAYDAAKQYLADMKAAATAWASAVSDTVKGALDFKTAAGSRDLLRTLRRQADAAKQFAEQFARMQKMGASQDLLDQIKAAGVEGGLQIMSQLASPAALAEANSLVADVAKVAEKLGADSAATIYDNDIALAEAALQAKTDALTKFYENQVAAAELAEEAARTRYANQIAWEIAQKEAQLANEQALLDQHLATELAKRELAEQAAADAANEAWKKYLAKLKADTKQLRKDWKAAMKAAGEKGGKKYGRQFKRALAKEIDGLDIGGGIAATSANGRAVVMAIKAYERNSGSRWRK